MHILLLHGVNLSMFGRRNPAHYGTATLEDINTAVRTLAQDLRVTVDIFQTNHEGVLVERIHKVLDEATDGLVINAGAWTHTSLAIADALEILTIPIVEVHMSNIYAREAVRHTSLLAPVVRGSIAGFGVESYCLGLRAVVTLATQAKRVPDIDA